MKQKIENLLDKMLFQLSVEELRELILSIVDERKDHPRRQRDYAYGMDDLAKRLHCSHTRIAVLKKEGVLEEAIISRVGRRIVFDVEKAMELTSDHGQKPNLPGASEE